jgi:hypothetical protein
VSVNVAEWSLDARQQLDAWRLLVSPTEVRFAMTEYLRQGEQYAVHGLYEVLDDDGSPRPVLAVSSRSVIDGALFERGWFVVTDADGRLSVVERSTVRLVASKALVDLVDGWLKPSKPGADGEAGKLHVGDAVKADPLTDGVQLAADCSSAAPASARDLLVRASLRHKGENANLRWGERVRHAAVRLLLALLLRLA